jgi:hypothetical protein
MRLINCCRKSYQPDGAVLGLEQQPCCVQVVEGVGLVASGFQFCTRLAAVFAEDVGDFGAFVFDGHI